MYSPPTASPCSSRNTSSSTGAASPIVAALGQEPDEERREGHREDRPDERLLATESVADPAEQRPADRPHEEPGGERPEGGEQRSGGIVAGKKCAPICAGEEAEQGEVVPLEHVADDAGDYAAADGGRGAELLGDDSRWSNREPRSGHEASLADKYQKGIRNEGS